MSDYDGGFKIAARSSAAGLCRLAGVTAEGWVPIGDTVQTTERLADRAFRATSPKGTRYVVYLEAYTRWVDSAPWNCLAKAGLLSERERMPTRCLMFVLTRQGFHDPGLSFDLDIDGEPAQSLALGVVRMWEQKPEPWWDHHPGLMALYPLCDHGTTAFEAVTTAAGSIRTREMDAARRTDLLTTLAIFGKMVAEDLDVLAIIRREEMHESAIGRMLYQDGALGEARQGLRDIIAARFGEESAADIGPRLDAATDLQVLRDVRQAALRLPRVSQLRAHLTRRGL